MAISIKAKQLRALLPEVVRRVRQGAKFTVSYRSRPAFRIIGIDDTCENRSALADDPLYCAPALGCSVDGAAASDHEETLYPA